MVMDKIYFAKLLLVLVRLILYGRQFELLVGLASNNFDVAPRVNQNAVYFEIGDHGGYAYRRIPGVLEDSKIFLSKGDRPFLPLLQTFGGGFQSRRLDTAQMSLPLRLHFMYSGVLAAKSHIKSSFASFAYQFSDYVPFNSRSADPAY